jgi:hypothetical protein
VESEVLDASPLFIQEMEMFPYESGLEFVMELHDRGGWEAVDAAYADPPVSTEQILHPERYADRELPLEVALPDLVAALSDDWQELDVDVMGELVLRLALAEYLGPGAASVAAEGWGGDQYVLLTAGAEGPHVLAVGLAFDDEAEAKEFWSLWRVYLNHRPGYSEEIDALVGRLDHLWWRSESGSAYAERAAERVTIVLGADEDAVAQVVDALGGH